MASSQAIPQSLKQLISILKEKKILLPPDAFTLLTTYTPTEIEHITHIIKDLPQQDILLISHDIKRFFSLARHLPPDVYFTIKTRLIVKHGKKLYDAYLHLFEEEARSMSVILSHTRGKTLLPKNLSVQQDQQSASIHTPQSPSSSDKTAIPSSIPSPPRREASLHNPIRTASSQMPPPSDHTRLPVEGKDYTILKKPEVEMEKRDLSAFISLLTHRYKTIRSFLLQRPDVHGVLPVRRALEARGDTVSVIVMIRTIDRREERISLIAEDEHDEIPIRIMKKDRQDSLTLWQEAEALTEDDIIYVEGRMRNGVLYATRILHPDIPLGKELPRSPREEYAVFISDLQYGSVDFLEHVFERFLTWLEGRDPDENLSRIANKVRYLFIVGDLLDGIGIYPKQYEELTVRSVRDQFNGITRLLSRIPSSIRIFIIPGNHDPVRLAEPQHPFYKTHADILYTLPNVQILPNPSWVRIGITENFSGITILLYHGYSFDYYANDIPVIHEAGGYNNPILLMSYLLKRRHLAPNYKSTLIMPGSRDHLIIDPIPDVFASGHIHRTRAGLYRNILLLETGCWQGMTPYMEKTGHIPEPGKAILLPLHTMQPSIIDFMDDETSSTSYTT